jgi:hypothetical protein
MSSNLASHAPSDGPSSIRPTTGTAESPVVLLRFAKLVTVFAALALLTPYWLNLMHQLGVAQSWYSLRLLAIFGGAGVLTLLVAAVSLLAAQLKDLARA